MVSFYLSSFTWCQYGWAVMNILLILYRCARTRLPDWWPSWTGSPPSRFSWSSVAGSQWSSWWYTTAWCSSKKVFKNKKPVYLYNKITTGSPKPNTRQAEANVRSLAALGVHSQPSAPSCDLDLTRMSWCWSSVYWYNKLPPTILSEEKEMKFKTRLKVWVSENVESLIEVD